MVSVVIDHRTVRLRIEALEYSEGYAWSMDGEGGKRVVLRASLHAMERGDHTFTGRSVVVQDCEAVPAKVWAKMSPRERDQMARDLCLRVLAHELDESFYRDGARVFDPHAEPPPVSVLLTAIAPRGRKP